jgi:DNA gyrase/topoisomerase IV subunit A
MEENSNSHLFTDIARRNFLIKQFFNANEIQINLLGDINNPLVVTEDNIVLSCYVSNFNLIFKDDSFEGKEVFTIKLKNDPMLCREKLLDWIKNANHRKIYIFTSEEGLYYSKFIRIYNGKLPLFSPAKELAYYVFQRQKAIEVVQKLKKDKIKLSIVL